MPFSKKELQAIDTQLELEQTLIKKYKLYASVCRDQQLKQKCEQVAAQHQDHYNRILSGLN